MILLDANLLLYAFHSASPLHERARTWLEGALNGSDLVGLPLLTVLAFVRIATNHSAFDRPLTSTEALTAVDAWLGRPNVTVPGPTQRHWRLMRELAVAGKASGPLMIDVHLAALAIEHGATLCTTDRDFARFPGLVLNDPLA